MTTFVERLLARASAAQLPGETQAPVSTDTPAKAPDSVVTPENVAEPELPKMYNLIFWNDSTTSGDLVRELLVKVFAMDGATALATIRRIEREGKAVVRTTTLELGEQLLNNIYDAALKLGLRNERDKKNPCEFLVSLEPAE